MTWQTWAVILGVTALVIFSVGSWAELRHTRAELRRLQFDRMHPSKQGWWCRCGRVRFTNRSEVPDGHGMVHAMTRCEPDMDALR